MKYVLIKNGAPNIYRIRINNPGLLESNIETLIYEGGYEQETSPSCSREDAPVKKHRKLNAPITIPKLAYIIRDVLDENNNNENNNKNKNIHISSRALIRLIKYATSDELIPIDEKIKKAEEKIDSNDEIDREKALIQLQELRKAKENKEYFDAAFINYIYTSIINSTALFDIESEDPAKETPKLLSYFVKNK